LGTLLVIVLACWIYYLI
jgi:hypothetical protein